MRKAALLDKLSMGIEHQGLVKPSTEVDADQELVRVLLHNRLLVSSLM
jgi:hypothetical protein